MYKTDTDELELQILGCILDVPSVIPEVSDLLTLDMINNINYKRLYDHICKSYFNERPLNFTLLVDEIVSLKKEVYFGGEAVIARLATEIVPTEIAIQTAIRLADKYWMKILIKSAQEIMNECQSQEQQAELIADKFIGVLMKMSVKSGKDKSITLQEACQKYEIEKEKFKKIYEKTGNTITGLPSGIKTLDQITTGFKQGNMIVIGARPSIGKTAIALNIATHVAFNHNKKVLFFSLEMDAVQLYERIVASYLDISNITMLRELDEAEQHRYNKFLKDMRKYPLFIEDTGSLSIADIRARSRRKYRDLKGLDMIIIDYLQFIIPSNDNTREQQISTISRGIKQLARELDIPIIACAQLNRKIADRENPYPKLSDLRDSGAIEQDSDLVLLLHREDKYKLNSRDFSMLTTQNARERIKQEYEEKYDKPFNIFASEFSVYVRAEDMIQIPYDIVVAKHRNGTTGVIKSTFYRSKTKFTDKYELSY